MSALFTIAIIWIVASAAIAAIGSAVMRASARADAQEERMVAGGGRIVVATRRGDRVLVAPELVRELGLVPGRRALHERLI